MIKPKKSVQQLTPYVNGKHSNLVFEQGPKVIKLDSNEASVAPSPRVIGALAEFVQRSSLNWYPDISSTDLIQRLADYTGLPVDHIQTFNGSDNALETICRTFLDAGDEVVLCMPTYDHFRLYAESCDATLVPVFGPSPFLSKVGPLLDAVTEKTKIIYLVNPNNPTGLLYTEREVRSILEGAKNALVIVDEAYFEFCGTSMAHLTQSYANLIVTRSFSKAFGLAGLRCGYVLTDPQNLTALNKVRVGKNINTLAQVAASAALDDLESIERYVNEVKVARSWLASKLTGLGLKVVETPANYLLLQVADPKGVIACLEEKNIFIRDRSFVPQLKGFVRITIGHQLLMERFWKAFQLIPMNLLTGTALGSKSEFPLVASSKANESRIKA